MSCFFSIIIPTYNRQNLLADTINSIIAQTVTDWECIVVDDGSTDNTRKLVEEIQKADSRIKYVYQNNAERSAARNNGVNNSTGEYICFLDSDDHFVPNHLQQLKDFICSQKEKVCMVINQSLVVSNEGEFPTTLSQPTTNPVEFLYLNPVSPSRVCIHSSILKQMKFDEDIVVVEDVVLWMRIADKFPVYVSQHIGVRYNIHEGNSVNRKGTGAIKTYQGILLALKRYADVFNKMSPASFRDRLSRVETNIAYHHLLNDRKTDAAKWLLKSIATSPFHTQTKMRLHHLYSILTGKSITV